MRQIPAYLETGVAMAFESGAAAWVFDLAHWGLCGQGIDRRAALDALAARIDPPRAVTVAEHITGDEHAFQRDYLPANEEEREATLRILADARTRTLALLAACTPAMLDFDDPARQLPAWARWRTLRQMAWHIADTESRYYLPRLGLPTRDANAGRAEGAGRAGSAGKAGRVGKAGLVAELEASAKHVQEVIRSLPVDLIRRDGGQVWTSTKLLRRLAWHERGVGRHGGDGPARQT